jgi:hypothetical protein
LIPKTYLSAYFVKGICNDITDTKNILAALKISALTLGYLAHGFPIDQIDTHSLQSGNVNTLSLGGYTDRQVQKMG